MSKSNILFQASCEKNPYNGTTSGHFTILVNPAFSFIFNIQITLTIFNVAACDESWQFLSPFVFIRYRKLEEEGKNDGLPTFDATFLFLQILQYT